MRVVVPEEKPIQRLSIPFGKLSEAVKKREEALKRAPIDLAPLTESTRMATVERDTKNGKLRGVESGESMEAARQRYAKEDGKPYVPPIEQEDDLGEIDLDMYLDNPDMRDFLIEESGRTPQSIDEGDLNLQNAIQQPELSIDAVYNKPEVVQEGKPEITQSPAVVTAEQKAKERAQRFLKGYNDYKTGAPIVASMADNAALMRSAPMMQTESAGLNSLQDQAKRYLNRLR
jgi:hypothetical protein